MGKKHLCLLIIMLICTFSASCNDSDSNNVIAGEWVWDNFTWGLGVFIIEADGNGSFVLDGTTEYTFTWEEPESGVFSMNSNLYGEEKYKYTVIDDVLLLDDMFEDDVHRYIRKSRWDRDGIFPQS